MFRTVTLDKTKQTKEQKGGWSIYPAVFFLTFRSRHMKNKLLTVTLEISGVVTANMSVFTKLDKFCNNC